LDFRFSLVAKVPGENQEPLAARKQRGNNELMLFIKTPEVNRFGENGAGERISVRKAGFEVNCPPATTLENNWKFRPLNQTESEFGQEVGWGGRITS
jgi:hypothetical protein